MVIPFIQYLLSVYSITDTVVLFSDTRIRAHARALNIVSNAIAEPPPTYSFFIVRVLEE